MTMSLTIRETARESTGQASLETARRHARLMLDDAQRETTVALRIAQAGDMVALLDQLAQRTCPLG